MCRRKVIALAIAFALSVPPAVSAQGLRPPQISTPAPDSELSDLLAEYDAEALAALDGAKVMAVDVAGNRRVGSDDIRVNISIEQFPNSHR